MGFIIANAEGPVRVARVEVTDIDCGEYANRRRESLRLLGQEAAAGPQ